MPNHRTQDEIINIAIKTGNTSGRPRLSDVRTALFGSNRRTQILKYLGQNVNRWHDAWEAYLRSKSINNSKYIEEERDVFHKTSTY